MIYHGINVTLCLCTGLYIASFLMMSLSSQPIEFFLNTDGICGSDRKNVLVRETETYKLRINVNRSSKAGEKCTSVFQSVRDNGRICILLANVRVSSCSMEAKLYDGNNVITGKEHLNINCDFSPTSVEWCTTTTSLTLVFRSSSLTGISFDAQIYDIGNKDRKVYMDKIPYCGSRFDLFSSTITISNMAPDSLPKDLFVTCTLIFGIKEIDNKTKLCLEFLSLNTKDCIGPYASYKLSVKENNFEVQSITVCQGQSTRCFTTPILTLELKRESSADAIRSEPRDLFTLKVFDRPEGYGGNAWSQRGINNVMVIVQCALSAAIMKQL